jgi:alpha-tubulin suppressor-like RCC1 family protein
MSALLIVGCSGFDGGSGAVPATAANAVVMTSDFPKGLRLVECAGSGKMAHFLESIRTDAANTFETNKQEWETAKLEGAVAAEVALYSDSETDCDAALKSGTGVISSPTAPLLISVAVQYSDAASAAKAYANRSIWGLSPSDMEKNPPEGTVQGVATGLGNNAIAWSGSIFGAPFNIALWQNRAFMVFMLALHIATDQAKGMWTAENARIRRLGSTSGQPSSPATAASRPARPSPISCSLTQESHPRVIAIASGTNSLALKSDGSVWAWGRGDEGQLGNGTRTDSNVPVRVANLNCVTAIAVGGNQGLALRTDGSAWAWGGNSRGQLGDGTGANSDTPVAVNGLGAGVVAIAAGDQNSLALKSDGSVWAWGRNDRGQLGNGTSNDSEVPVPVSGLASGVIQIADGGDFSLALRTDGSVWGWGNNFSGQLGNATPETLNTPTPVKGLAAGVKAISVGEGHSLALLANGSVLAWGKNTSGELGNGTTKDTPVPTLVSGLGSGVIAVAVGRDDFSLALKSDGSVWAWGWGAAGQLGDGSSADRHVPTPVTGLRNGVTAIAGGGGGGLALKSDGSVWAWGTNNHGELGNGITQPEGGSYVPVEVVGL